MFNRDNWRAQGNRVCAALLFLLVAGTVASLTLVDTGAAQAQDEDDPLGNAGQDNAGAGGGNNANNTGGSSKSDDDDGQSRLAWISGALGWVFGPAFLFLSFTLVALAVMVFLMARRDNIVPMQLIEAFEAHLNEKRYQEAYELAKADESFLGQVLSAGLAKLSGGYEKALEAMQEVGEEENMKIEHKLSYIALIASISTLTGLLGTVWGMTAAFEVIATSSTGAPSPQELAEDISTALVTTVAGLLLAIPAIAVFTIVKNRCQKMVLEVGSVSEDLMSRFQTVGVKKT